MLYDPLGELVTKKPRVLWLMCAVPYCQNNLPTKPQQMFFVPFEPNLRRKWLESVKIDLFPYVFKACLSIHRNTFFCEDHYSEVLTNLPSPYQALPAQSQIAFQKAPTILNSTAIYRTQTAIAVNIDHNYTKTLNEEQACCFNHNPNNAHKLSISPSTIKQQIEINIKKDISIENTAACEYCFIEFPDKYALQLHIAQEHLDIKPEMFQCNKCSASFIHEAEMLKHLKLAHEYHKPDNGNIQSHHHFSPLPSATEYMHISNELDIKPLIFDCNKCTTSFLFEIDLLRHLIEIHRQSENRFLKAYTFKIKEVDKLIAVTPLLSNFLNINPDFKHSWNNMGNLKVHCAKCNLLFFVRSFEKHVLFCVNKPRKHGTTKKHEIVVEKENVNDKSERVELNCCETCSINFISKDALTKHSQTIHRKRETNDNCLKKSEESYFKIYENFLCKEVCKENKTIKQIDKPSDSTPYKHNVETITEDIVNVKQEKQDDDTLSAISGESMEIKEENEDSDDTVSVENVETVQCYFCKLEFINRAHLLEHIKAIHLYITPNVICCKQCCLYFWTEEDILEHVKTCKRTVNESEFAILNILPKNRAKRKLPVTTKKLLVTKKKIPVTKKKVTKNRKTQNVKPTKPKRKNKTRSRVETNHLVGCECKSKETPCGDEQTKLKENPNHTSRARKVIVPARYRS